jgi:hypothetical protein
MMKQILVVAMLLAVALASDCDNCILMANAIHNIILTDPTSIEGVCEGLQQFSGDCTDFQSKYQGLIIDFLSDGSTPEAGCKEKINVCN